MYYIWHLICIHWMISLPVFAIGVRNGRIVITSRRCCAFVSTNIHSTVHVDAVVFPPPQQQQRYRHRCHLDGWHTRVYSSTVSSTSTARDNVNSNIQSIAIIGGGIAGLACAERLSSQSYNVTVYDTGRLRPGGRSSSRWIDDVPETNGGNNNANREDDDNDDSKRNKSRQSAGSNGLLTKFMYDHAAQVVSRPAHPRYKHFRQQIDEWESNGILRRFPKDTLYNIMSYKKIEPINNITFYYGTVSGGGIGGLSTSMVRHNGGKFQLQQNIWIPPRNGIQYLINQRKWKVLDNQFGRPSLYDAIVIAHNGKCADQIVRNVPSPDISKLMKVQFQYKVPACGGPCMTLSSIYSLTFAIPSGTSFLSKHLPDTFISGYVKNHPALRFLTCQTRKYGSHDENIEVWTVLSSGSFALKYKASQENLPNVIVKKVTRLLLLAIEEALTGTIVTAFVTDKNSDSDSDDTDRQKANAEKQKTVQPSTIEQSLLDKHLQLWGAGVPMNVWDTERGRTPAGYLYDGPYQLGVCGDWLVEASIAGAWTSGRLLADHMISNHTKSHGLKGSFRRSVATAKAGIGMLQV
jgi:predicted NAD/FAD-dependent oxidoreductase